MRNAIAASALALAVVFSCQLVSAEMLAPISN